VESGCSLVLGYYHVFRLEGLNKTMKNLNQDSRSPGPIFEPGTSRIQSWIVNYSTTTLGSNFLLYSLIDTDHSKAGLCRRKI
jgi:hypothetical protein